MKSRNRNKNYIIEYVHVGSFMKVSAIDPISGTEVSIMGDPKSDKDALAQTAISKLHYVQSKKKN